MAIDWEFSLHFDHLRAETREKSERAVLAGMRYLSGQVLPLVPVETGNLAGSMDVDMGVVDGPTPAHEVVAHIYFPGPYALYQHEGVYFRRPGHFGAPLSHTHGESFFLLRPMVQDAGTALAIVKEEMGL